MHVVQLLPELEEGGVERVVVDLSRELVGCGVTSTVISRGGRLVSQIEADGARHIRLDVCSKNPLTFLVRAWQLRRQLARLAPDVVHVHSRLPAWLLRIANHSLRLPVVTTVHGLNRPGFYSRILTHGSRVICVSRAVQAHLQKHYATPAGILRVVYFGIHAKVFDPARLNLKFVERFRREQQLDGCFVVISAGRLAPCKDYATFIRAILAARAKVPNIVGVIVGGGSSRHRAYVQQLHALVRELGAGDAIRFAGHCADMAELFALSDVVVSCSAKPESFGRTLAEALAMNTPVLATAHGGALEIVREGVDGYLFPPRDAPALAQALERIYSQRAEHNLRDSILQRFSMAQTVRDTLAVYAEAVTGAAAVAAESCVSAVPLHRGKLLADASTCKAA